METLPVEILQSIFIQAQNPCLSLVNHRFLDISRSHWLKVSWVETRCGLNRRREEEIDRAKTLEGEDVEMEEVESEERESRRHVVTAKEFFQEACAWSFFTPEWLRYVQEHTSWRCRQIPDTVFSSLQWRALEALMQHYEISSSSSSATSSGEPRLPLAPYHLCLALSSPKLRSSKSTDDPLDQDQLRLLELLQSHPALVQQDVFSTAVLHHLYNLIPHLLRLSPDSPRSCDIRTLLHREHLSVLRHVVQYSSVHLLNHDLKFALAKGWADLAKFFLAHHAVIWHDDVRTALEMGDPSLVRACLARADVAVWNNDLKRLLDLKLWEMARVVLEPQHHVFVYHEDVQWCLKNAPLEVNKSLLARPDVIIYYDDFIRILQHDQAELVDLMLQRRDAVLFAKWGVLQRRKSVLDFMESSRLQSLQALTTSPVTPTVSPSSPPLF